ncbi:MAG: hypothetical protein LBT22_00375 [Peptococcaceae bacterium]|jgi:YbbR domain-containing protein|nr:hypothetical protein [Peptococcaceae bacterium]
MYRVLKRNLVFKIVSLLIAVLLWFWVVNQHHSQALSDNSLTIPLYTQSIPANIMVMDKLPSVRVRLLGTNPSVSTNEIYAYLDLSQATVGKQTFAVKIDEIPGVQVVEILPMEVTLTLDQVREKAVPVVVNISGSPANAYEMGQVIVRPSAVNVRGPGSLLENLDRVTTEISVEGAMASLQVSRPVSIADTDGKPVTGPDATVNVFNISPQSVDIIVPIIPKELASKRIPVKLTSVGNPAVGFALRGLSPYPENILLYGTEEDLLRIDALSPSAVDISNLSEDGVFPIALDKISLPDGVTIAPGATLSAVASIGMAAVERRVSAPVFLRNLSARLELEAEIPPLDIVVKGYPEIVFVLGVQDISLWVEAGELSAGEHLNTAVNWKLPAGAEMIDIPRLDFRLQEKP